MRSILTALFTLAVPRVALACPVCFGQNDSPLAVAMNQGIFFMLVVIVCVLAAFAAFIVRIAWRQRMFDDQPPATTAYTQHDPQEGTV
jgi:hypothetical protein